MRRALCVMTILAGCEGNTITAGGGGGGGGDKPAGDPVPGEVKELTFTEHDRTFKVKAFVPAKWSEQVMDHARYYQGSWMSKYAVSITCAGSCDTVETARKNIAQQAQEHFEFTSSKNHIPPLVATWVSKLAEVSPGVWSWRFRAINDKEKQSEDQYSLDRILPPGDPKSTLILTCNFEIDEREPPGVADILEKKCKDMTYVEVTKPK
ncbi:MAG: hypothetical protein ABI867_22830 [Kofleriaceae bacterium]